MINHIKTKIRPAFSYFGGKALLCRNIINLLPEHTTYLEGFSGGLNVLLNKYKSEREIACDLNPDIIHFYKFLISNTQDLIDKIKTIPYTRDSFLAALHSRGDLAPRERAANFLVKYRMSRNCLGKEFFWSVNNPEGRLTAWESIPRGLVATANRLKNVEFYHESAFDCIPRYDSEDTLFYLDPPYYPMTRVSNNNYACELTEFQHLQLLRMIKTLKGHVVLSGYSCPLYENELKDWERNEFEMISPSSGCSKKKIKLRVKEVLWVKRANKWPF